MTQVIFGIVEKVTSSGLHALVLFDNPVDPKVYGVLSPETQGGVELRNRHNGTVPEGIVVRCEIPALEIGKTCHIEKVSECDNPQSEERREAFADFLIDEYRTRPLES